MTTTAPTDLPGFVDTVERRQALELIAIDGISGMRDNADDDVTRDDVLDYALRCICIELIGASLTAQELQEVAPLLSPTTPYTKRA